MPESSIYFIFVYDSMLSDKDENAEPRARSETVYLRERLQLLQDEMESNSHRHRLALDAFTAVLVQGSDCAPHR